ncbi:MAG: hypothetical protein JW750_03525 [Anaerolineaceae bacterium]|nr:hypothetical protein [Anaerolineaceae bacterium]
MEFDIPLQFEKKPKAPDRFFDGERWHAVQKVLEEWDDFYRGKYSRNMRPANLKKAAVRGSWGVGRFYYRVQTKDDHIYLLYYDRAPKDAFDRLGHWMLHAEYVYRVIPR